MEKLKLEFILDCVVKWLFYIVLFVGVLVFIGWLFVMKDLFLVFEWMVIVFIIVCFYVLGLVIFLVIVRSIFIVVKNGLFLKNWNVLE